MGISLDSRGILRMFSRNASPSSMFQRYSGGALCPRKAVCDRSTNRDCLYQSFPNKSFRRAGRSITRCCSLPIEAKMTFSVTLPGCSSTASFEQARAINSGTAITNIHPLLRYAELHDTGHLRKLFVVPGFRGNGVSPIAAGL